MNEVEIVVTSTDRSEAGVRSAENRIRGLGVTARRTVQEINAQEIKLKADISEAEADLKRLKQEAAGATGTTKIKVDADTAAAEARLQDLRRQLQDLQREKVKVDADTSSGTSKVEGFRRVLNQVAEGKIIPINVSVGGIGQVVALGAAIAALIPVALAAAGAVAGIGAVGAAGVTGIIGGFVGVGDAVKAMGDKATAGGGAVAASASQIRSATRSVEDAERSLKSAQEAEKTAQEDLTRARQDAAEELENLRRRTEDMALSQEGGSIAVARAQERLNELSKDGKASSLDLREARFRLHEAEVRLNQINEDAVKLSEKKATADAKGIEGSDQVVAAQKRIQQSHEQVVVATQRLADSQLALQEAMKPQGGGGSAVDKLAEAMKNLGPNAQSFVRFMRGFIDGPLKELRQVGQEAFLPGIEAGIKRQIPLMYQVTPLWAEFNQIMGKTAAGGLDLIGKLSGPFLRFAIESARGLEPLGRALQGLGADLGATLDRMTQTGTAAGAMEALSSVLAPLIDLLPSLVEYGAQAMIALGPGLSAVVAELSKELERQLPNIVALAGGLSDLLVQVAPMAPELLAMAAAFAAVGKVFTMTPFSRELSIIVSLLLAMQRLGLLGPILSAIGAGFRQLRGDAAGAGDAVDQAASRTASGAARLRGALGSVTGFLGGPWGAAIAVGTVVVGALAAKHADAARQVEELTAALQADSGAVGENTRAKVANQLETDGVLEKARALGLSLEDVTSAALGNVDAAARVNAALDQQAAALTNTGGAWQVAGRGAHAGADALQQFEGKAGTVRDAIDGQNESLAQARDQYQRTAEAMGQTADQAGQLGGQLDSATEATRRLRDEQAQAANDLLGLRGAETNYYEALNRTREAVQQNGETLSVHSARGLANRDALDAMAKAANDYLLKIQENEGEGPKFEQVLAQSRAALSRTAQQMGMSKAEADRLAAAIIAIPATKTTVIRADTGAAMAAINGVKAAITQLKDKTVTIRTVTVNSNGSISAQTNRMSSKGGRVPGVASMADTEPHLLAKGEYVVRSDRTERFLPFLEDINAGRDPFLARGSGGSSASAGGGSGGGGGGGGPVAVLLEVVSGGSQLDDMLVEIIRHAVRVRGGDVQVVLGR